MPERIYLVSAYTGEYEDIQEWNVCAYRTEEMAQQHASLAQQWYRDNDVPKRFYEREINGDRIVLDNPYDPHMWYVSPETQWYVSEVEIMDTLPEKS